VGSSNFEEFMVLRFLLKCALERLTNVWIGEFMEECLRKWYVRNESKELISIPFLVSRWILLARNSQIFDEKFFPSFKVYAQVRSIMPYYRMIVN
jgi:hypothetical protein